MDQIALQIFLILFFILLNGLFAMSEMAVVSARRSRLQQLADEGSAGALSALELASSPNRFLSTVQAGITLVGIFAGAVGGATLAGRFAPLFEPLPFVGAYAGAISLALVVGTITFLSVVLGELVPKRVALQRAEAISIAVAGPMHRLAMLATPLVRLLSLSTEGVLALLGIEAAQEEAVTEEEIKVLVEQGAQAGLIEEAERDMVASIFRLDDVPLEAIMTPRPEIVWLDINASAAVNRDVVDGSSHSRFPVCDGQLDRVLGIVNARDLLSDCLDGKPFDLREALEEPLYVPESVRALNALDRFRQTGNHVVLLVDEYGGIEGLVTLIDILETIVGDMPTPEEIMEPLIVERDDGSFLVDGLIPVEEFKKAFSIKSLPGEARYNTLAGFVGLMLGRLPQSGDHFGWGGLRFEVIDMDSQRIDKMLVEKEPDEGEEEGE